MRVLDRPAAAALLLAGGFAAIAFTTTGGVVDLAADTWVEIALTVIAAGCAVAALLYRVRAPRHGVAALLLFAVLAAFTFASIAWSVVPDTSWTEANRTLSYFGAFLAALALARLFPAGWRSLIWAVALATVTVSGYAVLAKVFPATVDATDPYGRFSAPFGYWNATGLMAALGLAPWLWVGARRQGLRAIRALAVPALSVLIAVLILSYSRGALAAAIIGLVCWFALVDVRLRAALTLGLGALGGAAITIWALLHHAITHDYATLHARGTEGHPFGLVVVVVLVLALLAGLIADRVIERVAVTPRTRRRIGIGLLCAVALIPVGAVVALAASSRGFTGEISHVYDELTNPSNGVSNSPGRLVQVGSSRPRYWGEGIKVGEHAVLKGVGAGGFGTAVTRYTTNTEVAQHAHSYLVQTFADLGLIGLLVSLTLVVAWLLASARVLAGRSPPAERIGLVTIFAVALTFGLHSLIDWTWFIPGVAVPGIVCAGWLAGCGSLTEPVRSLRQRSPGALAGTIALAIVTLVAVWFIWQPLRSADADAAALTAISNGNVASAAADARAAATEDPLSIQPLLEQAAIYNAVGEVARARRELMSAVYLQPANPASWLALGQYDLVHGTAEDAAIALDQALHLDLSSQQIRAQLGVALKRYYAQLARAKAAARAGRRPPS